VLLHPQQFDPSLAGYLLLTGGILTSPSDVREAEGRTHGPWTSFPACMSHHGSDQLGGDGGHHHDA
jgi:hypothetical protein